MRSLKAVAERLYTHLCKLAAPRTRRVHRWSGTELLENRCLLSSIRLIGSELVIGGDGANNQFEVSFDGKHYTIKDHSGSNINIHASLSARGFIDLDGVVNNQIVFDPEHSSIAGFTHLVINGNIGNDSVTVTSFRAGKEGFRAGAQTELVVINGAIGSATAPAANGIVLDASQIRIGADLWSDVSVEILDPVTLLADVHIGSPTGTVQFTSTVNGGFRLSVSGERLDFGGHLGNTTALSGLTIQAGTQVGFTGNVTVSGGDISISANSITRSGTFSGNRNFIWERLTAGDQNVSKAFLDNLSAGFRQVTIGGQLTSVLTLQSDGIDTRLSSARLNSPSVFIGESILVEETLNNSHAVTFVPGNHLRFGRMGSCLGTAQVSIISQVSYFGSGHRAVRVEGAIGHNQNPAPWGACDLLVQGEQIDFVDAVGGRFTSINAIASERLSFQHRTAIVATGSVTIDAPQIELTMGAISQTGDTVLYGDIYFTGTTLLAAGARGRVVVKGNLNGQDRSNLTIRGQRGPLSEVVVLGEIQTEGRVLIDAAGAGMAQYVELNGVAAGDMILRAHDLRLAGDLVAYYGNMEIAAKTTLENDIRIVSKADRKFVRFHQPLDGAYNLAIEAPNSSVSILGNVGHNTPLNSMEILSAGATVLGRSIEVATTFRWTIQAGSATAARLQLARGQRIVAGESITLKIDGRFQNVNGGLAGLLSPLVEVYA